MTAKSYTFVDRRKGAENLMLVLAGFQPFYWDVILARVKKAQEQFGEELDVCVCLPKGVDGAFDKLKGKCEKYDWSLLDIHKDLLAQAQNTAIMLHPNAKWIFKIDEDIIVPPNFFSGLKHSYLNLEKDDSKYYDIGFMGPLINLNGCGTPVFLKSIGKVEDFDKKYGKFHVDGINFDHSPVHGSGDFATDVWKESMPFDSKASEIAEKNEGSTTICPSRFSIGAMLFTRYFWNHINGFQVGTIGAMGVEEIQVNNWCQTNFYGIYLANDVLCGHLGFFGQKKACREFFEEHKRELMPE